MLPLAPRSGDAQVNYHRRSLIVPVVIPLLLLSVVTLAIHRCWDLDGLLVNLSATFLGILVTVAYVDWIIRRHEERSWAESKARIDDRLLRFVNASTSGIRVSLGFPLSVLGPAALSGDPDMAHEELMRVSREVLEPRTLDRITLLSSAGWAALDKQLSMAWLEADGLLTAFQGKLDPRRYEKLMAAQDALQRARIFYWTFPDLAGVPAEELPSTRTPPADLQEHGCRSTAEAVGIFLRVTRELAEVLMSERG
jgi:hypothetical protein